MGLGKDAETLCLGFLPKDDVLYVAGDEKSIPSRGRYAARNGFVQLLPPTPSTLWYVSTVREARYLFGVRRVKPCALRGVANVEVLRYLHGKGCWWDDKLYRVLASRGATEALRFAAKHGPRPRGCALSQAAAESGTLACVRLVHEELKVKWDAGSSTLAAQLGHVEVLRYAYTRGLARPTGTHMDHALANGHLHCALYIHSLGVRWSPRQWPDVVRAGFVDGLKFLVSQGCVLPENACQAAQHIEMLDYLMSLGHQLMEDTMETAVRQDDIELAKWLQSKNCPWTWRLCNIAARLGNVSMLKLLRSFGGAWGAHTIADAAGAGHLHVVRYAHENGCSWDVRTCNDAVRAKSLPVLQYAHANGCEWTTETLKVALKEADAPIIAYLLDNGCPWDPSLYIQAIRAGATVFLREALARRMPGEVDVCAEAACVGVDLLAEVYAAGLPWDATTCVNAVYASHFDCLQFAYEHGCPWDARVIEACLMTRDSRMLTYAQANGCPA